MKIGKLLNQIDPLGINRPMPKAPTPRPPESKLVPCADCGNEVSKEAAMCPHCGKKLTEQQTAIGLLAAIIIALIVGGLLYAAIGGLAPIFNH